MKISIIGYSGSGKSTLAGKLAEKYGAPVLYLDTLHWLPGWKERPREEELTYLGSFLDENDSWVIDGNYGKLHFERRTEEADLIILMLFSRFSSLRRIIRRYRENKGRTRDSMTDGCPEKIDREFLHWVLIGSRTKKRRQLYSDVLKKHRAKCIIIKNQRQLDRYEKSQFH